MTKEQEEEKKNAIAHFMIVLSYIKNDINTLMEMLINGNEEEQQQAALNAHALEILFTSETGYKKITQQLANIIDEKVIAMEEKTKGYH